ncbi:hypothetical protein Dsin_015562 [Dipteronia sinensis]|uniref:Reverse transcriptase domain-containing protein n=1 Tax=Dipteronia sinensis TaxID=43782 RepID=A0AAE0AC19_9ROSI|nr:hypothetical protein Dsin_015562 [Dipteronia sinensis]
MPSQTEKKRKRTKSSMAIKLDMSKAYDRVEWLFLEGMMGKLGFSSRWTGLLMRCVSSVTYSILINGEVSGNITPTRGLRQGDPLSLFLLLICAEGLTSLIQKAQVRVKTILVEYAKASGQVINVDKSAMCISYSFTARDGANLAATMGIKFVESHENYLGLPCFTGRSKGKLFANTVDLVWGKIKGWGEKLLSVAGKRF